MAYVCAVAAAVRPASIRVAKLRAVARVASKRRSAADRRGQGSLVEIVEFAADGHPMG